jgi:peptidylprolyl isomerase
MQDLKTYFEENGLQPQKTPEGLYYVMENEGNGKPAQAGTYVKVHYTGRLLDGSKFDSSHDRNEPFVFQLGAGQVIKGWDIGLALLKEGGRAKLYLPHQLGYGAQGAGGKIPPFAPLTFEVELLEVMDEATYQKDQASAKARQKEAYLEKLMAQLANEVQEIDQYAQKANLNLQRTPMGLAYAIYEQGSGPKAEKGKAVAVHYEGRLLNGQVFDSSRQRGEPIRFPLGEGKVIPGWDEGIPLFNEGGRGMLVIPSPFAYGPRQVGPIPPNSILVFEIEVVKVG